MIFETALALLTLTMLEIVLGIDNVIFITILVEKLPERSRKKGRLIGLFFAMFTRIALLCTLSWMANLTAPLIRLDWFLSTPIPALALSGRDLILIIGGGFLFYKSLIELLHFQDKNIKNTSQTNTQTASQKKYFFWFVMGQIAVIDIIFSLDSIITAVGLVNEIPIMISAIVLSVFIMMFLLKPIGDLLDRYPSFKILALCYLLLIGLALVSEGFDIPLAKSYLYFSMGFAFVYETLRIGATKLTVHLGR